MGLLAMFFLSNDGKMLVVLNGSEHLTPTRQKSTEAIVTNAKYKFNLLMWRVFDK